MQTITTLPTSSLASIAPELLLLVSGGCHKHHGCCAPAPVQQQCVVNVPPAPAPQILPQVGPQPQLPPSGPAPSGPTGDVVSTNVSINGQPVAAQ